MGSSDSMDKSVSVLIGGAIVGGIVAGTGGALLGALAALVLSETK